MTDGRILSQREIREYRGHANSYLVCFVNNETYIIIFLRANAIREIRVRLSDYEPRENNRLFIIIIIIIRVNEQQYALCFVIFSCVYILKINFYVWHASICLFLIFSIGKRKCTKYRIFYVEIHFSIKI